MRALALLVLAATCAVAAPVPVCAEGATGREDLVKAAFLYHFVEFVDWPDSIDAVASPVIRVGIVGEDPFGELLDEVFVSPSATGARFEILRTDDPRAATGCRLVFLALDDDDALAAALDVLDDAPVLTVAHREGFATAGGHVNFFVEDERLRFEINLDAVHDAGLRLSSRLLKLARIVTTEPAR